MLRAAAAALCLAAFTLPAAAADYVAIPGGSFASVLPPDGKAAPATVAPFRLRSLPVTNAEFLDFVRANPQWDRGRIASLFGDSQYLAHWSGPSNLGGAGRNQRGRADAPASPGRGRRRSHRFEPAGKQDLEDAALQGT